MHKRVAGIASHLFLEYLQISSCLFFRLLFMPKLVRNNTEVLFLSRSIWKGSVIAISVLADPGCGSLNLSLLVSFVEISRTGHEANLSMVDNLLLFTTTDG